MHRLIISFTPKLDANGLKLSIDPSSSFLHKMSVKENTEYIFALESDAEKLITQNKESLDSLKEENKKLLDQLRGKDYEINILRSRVSQAIRKVDSVSNMPDKLLTHIDEHYLRTAFALKVKGFIKELKEFLGE